MKKKSHLEWKIPQKLGKTLIRFMFLFALLVPSGIKAQEITMRIEKGSLDRAFQQIMKESNVQLVYNTDVALKISCETIAFEKKTIPEILNVLLAKTGLSYRVENGIYIISDKKRESVRPLGKIFGLVEDKNGEPLVGVALVIKGTYQGVATGVDGKFQLEGVRDSVVTLVVSYIGKKTKEVLAKLNTNIVIKLEDDASEIDEVVVTGYQKISREKVTGSASTVSSEDLSSRYMTNIMDNLEGRVAGLVNYDGKMIIRGTSSLYAATSPLLVVDGLPVEGNIEDLNPYDIESVTVLKDAAAAAIYGARASNGIVVITTKKAKKMGATEIDFSGNLTIYEKKNMDYHDNFYMNPSEQVDVESAYWDYYFFRNRDVRNPISTIAKRYSKSGYISAVQNAYYLYATNAIDETELERIKSDLRKNNFAKEFGKHVLRRQFLQQYNLALRNRTEKFNSNIVINFRRDNSGIIQSYDNQLNIAYRASYLMKKWLTVNFGATGILSKIKESASNYATDPFNIPSYTRLLNEDGSYNYYSPTDFNQYYTKDDEDASLKSMNFNHLEEMSYDHKITDRRNMRYQGEFVFNVIDGLTMNTSFIYETERQHESNYSEADSYAMRYLRNAYTQAAGKCLIPETGGKLATEDRRGEYWTARAQVNFNRILWEKHGIDFLGGIEFRETLSKGAKGLLLGYDDRLQSHGAMNVDFLTLQKTSGSNSYFADIVYNAVYSKYIRGAIDLIQEEHHRYASSYMNVTYTYDNRYNLFASFRKDYADLFGTNAKFRGKPLWSVGASWNIDREAFIGTRDWLSSLKLRVSYGKTGNIYQGTTSYMTGSTGTTNIYTGQPLANVKSPANPNLKWEKTETINVGVDFSLFNRRLRGSIDWYNKKGSDIFSRKTLESTKGFSYMNMNMADMKNNGIELSLSNIWFQAREEGSFTWTTSMTAAYNKNKITNVESQATNAASLVSSGFKKGYPTSALFSYRYAGLDQEGSGTNRQGLGQPLYWTEDGQKMDGSTITRKTVNSLVYSGQTDPKISLAMEQMLRYKGFSLNFMMVYYGGHKMRVRQYAPLYQMGSGRPLADYYVNAWSPTNTETDVPGIGEWNYTSVFGTTYTYTDIFVQSANFLKIRNITFGYDVPRDMIRLIGLNNLQVRFQIDNLPALWKKNHVGVDPETEGIRKQMKYIVGLNFNF